jgi:peroxiredoxin
VQVLGIDVRDDDRQAPQDFVRNRGLTYPSIYDPSGRSLLQLSGYPRNIVPSTIVLDKQHRVAAVFLRELLAQDLLPTVQRLAAEN